MIARIQGVSLHVVLRIYVGFMLDKKFASKEMAFTRRRVQRTVLPEQEEQEKKLKRNRNHTSRWVMYLLSFAFTSALRSTRNWQTSIWPSTEDQCSELCPLTEDNGEKSKQIITPEVSNACVWGGSRTYHFVRLRRLYARREIGKYRGCPLRQQMSAG